MDLQKIITEKIDHSTRIKIRVLIKNFNYLGNKTQVEIMSTINLGG